MVAAGPYYSRRAFKPADVQKIVAWAVAQIQLHGIEALAACGHSGLLVAGAIGHAAKIPVFAVRKPDDRHYDDPVNGVAENPVARWAFVDDLIETGGTFDRTRKLVYESGLTTTAVPTVNLLYGWPHEPYRVVDLVPVPQLYFPET